MLDTFKEDSPMWRTMKNSNEEYYFYENNYEEIINRFTQIKNALGIKEARALTVDELKRAYQMFKNGDKRISNNNMDVFFDGIKDWKAASKLSGKALSLTGIGYLGTKATNNE